MGDIDFEVVKDGHIISDNGYTTLELNYLKWNDYPAKYDLRRWNGEEPYKGITITDEELAELLDVIADELGMVVIPKDSFVTAIKTLTEKIKELEEIKEAVDDNEIDNTACINAVEQTSSIVEQVADTLSNEEPTHVRKCENCMHYRKGDCGGISGPCDEYVFSPTISEEELEMWPKMGDASYMRTHNGWGRK